MKQILTVLISLAALALALGAGAQQDLSGVEINALRVRDNLFMLVGAGGNITVQTGEQGILIVDTQYAELTDRIMAKIRELSDGELRYIIDTHFHGDHTGGNATLRARGRALTDDSGNADTPGSQGARIVAHENVRVRLAQDASVVAGAWPSSTYTGNSRTLYFNGENIRLLYQPGAHTDGDSIVYFPRADVISAGDIYFTEMFPLIDVAAGGSIQGIISAVGNIIDLISPANGQESSTLVIPGHGRLSELEDVLAYRDMLVLIRDRIQSMIDQGMTLEQVQAANPTREYDDHWGRDSGFWTTEQFVAAIFLNLSQNLGEQVEQ